MTYLHKADVKPFDLLHLANVSSQIRSRLVEARGKMTQEEAARRARDVAAKRGIDLNLHKQTLSDYERGKIKKIPTEVVSVLAVVYGVSPVDLLSDEDSEVGQNVVRGTIASEGSRISELRIDRYTPDPRIAPGPKTPRSALFQVHSRIAELTDGDEEREAKAFAIVQRSADAFSAGGSGQATSREDLIRLIESVGASVIKDLEEERGED